MADKEIGDLTLGAALDGTELVHVVQSSNSRKVPAQSISAISIHGQCRLAIASGDVKLSPYNGNRIVIDGVAYSIPSAGVTLSASALGDGVYYIYAYMVSTTMTLEASATARATDTTTGIEIKSADSSRTLVGLARVVSTAWTHCISWFNRRYISANGVFSTDRTTTSTSIVEINSEARADFLSWADDQVEASVIITSSASSSALSVGGGVSYDGTSDRVTTLVTTVAGGYYLSETIAYKKAFSSDGYHYVTIVGVTSGGTATYYASGAAACFLTVSASG